MLPCNLLWPAFQAMPERRHLLCLLWSEDLCMYKGSREDTVLSCSLSRKEEQPRIAWKRWRWKKRVASCPCVKRRHMLSLLKYYEKEEGGGRSACSSLPNMYIYICMSVYKGTYMYQKAEGKRALWHGGGDELLYYISVFRKRKGEGSCPALSIPLKKVTGMEEAGEVCYAVCLFLMGKTIKDTHLAATA